MRHHIFSVAAGLMLAALAAMPVKAAPGDLGNDMAGQACRIAGNDILCGNVRTGGLTLVALSAPAGEAPRRAAVASAIRALPADAAGGLRCDAGRSLDADTLLFGCMAGAGDAPHVVLAVFTAPGFYLADGLPGMIEVLSAAVKQRSGAPVSGAAAAAAAVRAQYSRQVLTAAATDYSAYLQLRAKGSDLSARGDYAAAEQVYRDALGIETRLFGPNSAAVGGTLLELALQVSNQQRFQEAAALFQRATPIVDTSTAPEIRLRLLSYRAIDAGNQRHYEDALAYARQDTLARQQAVDAARGDGMGLNGGPPVVPTLLDGELAHALRVQASLELRNGNLAGAQAAADNALYIISRHPDLPLAWRADIVSLMADVNAGEGRVVPAERNYTDAVAMNRKLFGETGPTIRAELALGAFYSGEQLYPAAIAAYRDAFAAIAKNPGTQVVADQIVPFLAAANAARATGGARLDAEMFTASQMVDAGVASQTIARMAAGDAAATPALAVEVKSADDAVRARDEARMALAVERAKTNDQRDASREAGLATTLESASRRADAVLTKLHQDFPAYAGLADPAPASLEALRAALHPREAFVSFVIGVKGSYVLLATRDGLTARPLATNVDELAAEIADLRSAFTPQLGKLPEFSLANAATLYRKTLGPIAPQLANIDHLVVAANGDLASLPFALLVTAPSSSPNDYVHAAWLIRQMAISQTLSARAFLALRRAPHAPEARPFMGIGDPAFQGAGANQAQALNALASTCQQGPADPALLRALQPLPDSAAEIQAVGRDLGAGPGDILLGAGANERAVRAKPLDQYAVIYFATHGLLPGELHCQAQPALVLSPPPAPAASADADGLLTASEIAGLKINADLVVLSACNTAAGGGRRFGGGALEGLADAFFHAGAHEVLASHWEVPSADTTALMTATFAYLATHDRHDTAEALRQAQLARIAQPGSAHPFQWAAFTLIGDGA